MLEGEVGVKTLFIRQRNSVLNGNGSDPVQRNLDCGGLGRI
jgi:hypothetical protein